MGTFIVLIVVAAIVAAVVLKMVKDKKSGKSGCGKNCSCCQMAGMCHSPSHKPKTKQ